MQFFAYILRRLAGLLAAAVLASLLIFLALNLLPGDAASVMAGTNSTPEQVQNLKVQMGLDRPLTVRYLEWLNNIIHFNFGVDSFSGLPISTEFSKAFIITINLSMWSLLFAIIVGIVFPILIFMTRQNKQKNSNFSIALFLSSVPAVFLATVLILIFGKGVGLIGVFPVTAISSSQTVYVIPALAIGIIAGARLLRFTKTALEESDEPFVLNYCAIGFTRKFSQIRSGFRSKLGPVVSVTVLTATELITGVVILEKMFALCGIGSELIKDVLRRDLPKVETEVFLLICMVLLVGFLLDIAIALLDPRVVKKRGAHVKTAI